MFSSVSNVLPLHVRQELPAMEPPLEPPKPSTHNTAAVETPRPATAAERRANGGRDPEQKKNDKRERDESDDFSQLSESEREELRKLKARDAEVRRHEQAHAAAGGPYAGAPSYQYRRGPDGRNYAESGQVSIDSSAIPGDPEATAKKMEQVRRAALAPADPSGQDQRVAASAVAKGAKARAEIQAQRRAEESETREDKAVEAEEADTAESEVEASAEANAGEDAATEATSAETSSPEAAGRAAQETVQSSVGQAAYQTLGTRNVEPPKLDLMACRDCGGVHAPS